MTPAESTSPPAAAAPRRSATLVVVRDGAEGLEVLLLRRAEKDDANGGAWVFPGGLVDRGDAAAAAMVAGPGTHTSSLGTDIADAVTAIRECFEECGLLFARDAQGHEADAWTTAPWQSWREPLNRGERGMDAFMRQSGFTLSLDALVPWARWVTPIGMRKRFDTRFFVARAPCTQAITVDGVETVEHRWMRPGKAVARGSGMKLLTPTHKTLEFLSMHGDVASALAAARATHSDAPVMPRLGQDRKGMRPVTPDEPAYVELGHLDPHGQGHVRCYMQPGHPVRLSERVIRVTAPNPSIMTGPGTNSYLVGGGPANVWAVVDPGPDIDEHLQALLAAAPGPIRWIFATHTHRDHSPLWRKLAAATGARVHGRVAAHMQAQDDTFEPDGVVDDGALFALEGANTTLQALHTPGHASNHVCYRLLEEDTLFTGDHVMQRATVVINPPDGNMAAYIASLQRLATEHANLRWLAPGHGFLIDEPLRVIQGIVAHRLAREAKVLEALRELGPVPLPTLLARVYDDVPEAIHSVAQRSLLAHLEKVMDAGRVTIRDSKFQLST